MVFRKSQSASSLPQNNYSFSMQVSDATASSLYRKRARVITREVIEELKVIFSDYKESLKGPQDQRVTFKELSAKMDISKSQLHALYSEFCKDPLLINRLNRIQERTKEVSSI